MNDGIPLVVNHESAPTRRISGAELKQLVGSDLSDRADSFDFSVESPDGSLRPLQDTHVFVLHAAADTLIKLSLRSHLLADLYSLYPNPADLVAAMYQIIERKEPRTRRLPPSAQSVQQRSLRLLAAAASAIQSQLSKATRRRRSRTSRRVRPT